MLGEREVRRWVRLVATLAAGQDKPSDLILSALVRARFCETLSSKIQHGGSDLFLLGLISAMDSILGIPMSDVLENVPLDQETAAVLRGGASPLRPLYQLMLAQESGNWESVPALTRQLSLDETEVAAASAEAMQWAREVTSS
jgi:c-di-GMP phosphodiesterase